MGLKRGRSPSLHVGLSKGAPLVCSHDAPVKHLKRILIVSGGGGQALGQGQEALPREGPQGSQALPLAPLLTEERLHPPCTVSPVCLHPLLSLRRALTMGRKEGQACLCFRVSPQPPL